MCILFVDDIIFWTRNEDDINNLETELRELGAELEQKDDAAEFMSVTFERYLKTGLLDIKMTGLIQHVIKEVDLDDVMSKGKFTSLETKTLVKDENSEPASGMFSCIRVVEILLYLYGHTLPYFSFAVNICDR